MPELKTMKEWNPQKGDVFRYHPDVFDFQSSIHVFYRWERQENGRWVNSKGVVCGNGNFGRWELIRRAGTIITLDKEWAYRHTPTQPVRILCIDGYNKDKPVVSMGPDGKVSHHDSHGAFLSGGGESGFDLVPLEKSFGPVWAVFSRKGGLVKTSPFEYEAKQKAVWLDESGTNPPYTVVKMVEEK
jgi:hypothetical protein